MVWTFGYGFLFSDAGCGRCQQGQRHVQTLAQVNGGVVARHAVGGGPEIQGVSGAAALEAVEGMGVGIDAEAACGAVGRTVQGAGAALLASVVGTRVEAEQRQHLGDGDGSAYGGEVDRGT